MNTETGSVINDKKSTRATLEHLYGDKRKLVTSVTLSFEQLCLLIDMASQDRMSRSEFMGEMLEAEHSRRQEQKVTA